jgi:hypothetical protein
MLCQAALEGKKRDQHSHHDRAGDILEQRRIGKRGAEQTREGEIETVPKRSPDAAPA